jgi:hypothetical protein
LPMFKPIFFLLTAFCLGTISAAAFAEDLQDPAMGRLLEEIIEDYGVDLFYAEGPASKPKDLDYDLADTDDSRILETAVMLFAQEIRLYPKNFFRAAHCRGVFFVRKLFYKRKPADGMFLEGAHFIFYDYSRHSENTRQIRHYIHHELFHMIGSRHPFWKERGPAWEALNRSGFLYNKKYNPQERNPINFYAPPEPGFITDYAMTSAEEDRAEVFACMMIPEELALLEEWAQKDKILFKKEEMMKEFLAEKN